MRDWGLGQVISLDSLNQILLVAQKTAKNFL
jgi:hypothetical protein